MISKYIVGVTFALCYTRTRTGEQAKMGFRMRYNYNKLWKLLIDKKMSQTAMRKQAGISTNIFVKMGKDEPISLERLAKICTTLNCGLDDITKTTTDTQK